MLLERIARKRRSRIEVIKRKRQLAVGDLQTATESFAAAKQYQPSMKLSVVVLGMRIAPRIFGQIVRLTRN